MYSPLIFLHFFAIIYTILGSEKNEGKSENGKSWADGQKVFDDPYLAAVEKDADVYDAVENRLSDIIAPKKRNPYKEVKKRPSSPSLGDGALDRLFKTDDHRKMFEEMATFNYGMIGVLKKQMEKKEEEKSNEEQKHDEKKNNNAEQRHRWWSSSEEVGWEQEDGGEEEENIRRKGPVLFKNAAAYSTKLGKEMPIGNKNEEGKSAMDEDWRNENAALAAEKEGGERHFDGEEMVTMNGGRGINAQDETGKENLDLDTVGWFE